MEFKKGDTVERTHHFQHYFTKGTYYKVLEIDLVENTITITDDVGDIWPANANKFKLVKTRYYDKSNSNRRRR